MSYDVYFKAKLEGIDQWVSVAEPANHTSNTAELMKIVLGKSLKEFDGAVAKDVADIFYFAVVDLINNRNHYRKHEPENGWGSVYSTAIFLAEISDVLHEFSTAIIEVRC